MKVLIIPTIREFYKNQFEYCVDLRLVDFIKKVFKKPSIEIYDSVIKNNYDFIVFAGGNNLITQTRADKNRKKINNTIYKFAIKKNIKMLGICHGCHFLAKKNNFVIKKGKNHVGSHKVIFDINNNRFKKLVNSYHNEIIKFKKTKRTNIFGTGIDNTVEAFHIKTKRILGIMWHPERYKKFKYFDKKLIKEFYATNSIGSR
jgi:putative glutamine amidotransferase